MTENMTRRRIRLSNTEDRKVYVRICDSVKLGVAKIWKNVQTRSRVNQRSTKCDKSKWRAKVQFYSRQIRSEESCLERATSSNKESDKLNPQNVRIQPITIGRKMPGLGRFDLFFVTFLISRDTQKGPVSLEDEKTRDSSAAYEEERSSSYCTI